MDLVVQPTLVGAGKQLAEQFFGDPGRGDVLIEVGGEQLGMLVGGEPFSSAQRSASVYPLDVDLAAAPASLGPGESSAHSTDHSVGLPDQMEPVGDHDRVG